MSLQKGYLTHGEELVSKTNIGLKTLYSVHLKHILLLSALQICFSTLFATALYQMLIFDLGLTPMLIGIITTLQAFIAIVSPVIFRNLINRVGSRNILIITGWLFIFFNLVILGWSNTFLMIIILFLDTILTKGFWLNINLLINKYQQNLAQNSADLIYKKYTMFWSLGAIFGFFIAIMLSIISNNIYLHLQSAMLFAILSMIYSYKIRNPTQHLLQNTCYVNNRKKTSHSENSKHLAGFSLLFLMIALFSYEVLSTFIDFTMPYLFESQENSYFWVYLILFSQQINQTFGIRKSSEKSVKGKFYLFLIGMIITGVLLYWILINPTLIVTVLTMMIYGGLAGLMYAFPNQTLIQYSENEKIVDNLTKYGAISALGSSLVPLMSGYLMNENYKLNIKIASGIAFFIPCILFVLYRKDIPERLFNQFNFLKISENQIKFPVFYYKPYSNFAFVLNSKYLQNQYQNQPKRALVFFPVVLPDFRIWRLNVHDGNSLYQIHTTP